VNALPRAPRLAAVLFWALPLGAQTRTSPAITPQDLRQRLYLIADDSMGGRRSGSVGDFQTAAHVASEFQRLGLRPAGDGGTWFSYARYGIPSVALSRGEHLNDHQVTDEAQYIDHDDLARVALPVHDGVPRVADLDHRPALDHPKGNRPASSVQ
jgi:hypothetical protein